MEKRTQLVLGFFASFAGVYLVTGVAWSLGLQKPAMVGFALGGLAILTVFGYLGYRHLAQEFDDAES